MLILLYSLASQSSALSHFTGINTAKYFLPKYTYSTSKGFPTDKFPGHEAKTKKCSINKATLFTKVQLKTEQRKSESASLTTNRCCYRSLWLFLISVSFFLNLSVHKSHLVGFLGPTENLIQCLE